MAGFEGWDREQHEEEIEVLKAIFEDDVIVESQSQIRISIQLNLPEGMKYLNVSLDHDRCDLPGARLKSPKPELQLRHLTPLTMKIAFPQDYPKNVPPEVSLDCLWLSSRLKKILHREIVKLFQPGMPVIYEWVDWMKNSCMDFLEFSSYAVIYLDETSADEFYKLYDFDQKEHLESFKTTIHSCLVCFNELPGNNFVLLPQCQHHFCKECIEYICSLNVTEGTLKNLVCPEEKCDEEIPPNIIKSTLSTKLYERWQNLTLSKCLDRMADLQYCPRCEKASLQEPGSIGRCYHCNFVFCLTCRQKWHAGEKCFQAKIAEDNSSEDKDTSGDGQKTSKVNWEDYAYLISTSKRCPDCNTAITKISGCNHVVCSVCRCHMCWYCGEKTNGYDHFQVSPECTTIVGVEQESKMGEQKFKKIKPLMENLEEEFFSFYCICGAKNYQINRLLNYANCVSCEKKICFCCCVPFKESVQAHYSLKNRCYLRNANENVDPV